jgi:endonuclease-8
MLRSNLHHPKRITARSVRGGLAVYGRNVQRCARCADTIECRRMGEHRRILYWCPGCQTHLDPRLEKSADDTPMDPHPAAQRWLAELPWNRDAS